MFAPAKSSHIKSDDVNLEGNGVIEVTTWKEIERRKTTVILLSKLRVKKEYIL